MSYEAIAPMEDLILGKQGRRPRAGLCFQLHKNDLRDTTCGFDDPLVLVHTFLGYPLDLEPVNPETVLPLVWQAQTRGFYSFRGGWRGPSGRRPSANWTAPTSA